ncbi:baculoviral IAP repeat-containing protein 7-like [Clavelina lepadiformis]|uniref:baculoviral IAP repeat-containing protein 7-like n=1 Tax=Clavelina lepadiformis TaxID=159417 RepID=UPI004042787A
MISMATDPPGQRSVYIPPGDTKRETYRLATFKDFPSNVPVDVRRLASRGFYFTGYKDRVKCFSCGQSQQEWTVGDNPDNSGWHRHDCQHALGQDASNVPLLSFIQRPGMTGCAIPQPHLAQSDPNRPSRSLEVGERPIRLITKMERSLPTTISLFPCSNVSVLNPHMRSKESRLQTFLDFLSWPAHRIRATPRQIANAGMYYLGVRDQSKGWYCNGGLQNWERDDDPWEEHAKWFPMCEYVLQRKGPDYVHGLVSRFPNLRRPIIRNPANPTAQLRHFQSGSRGNPNAGPTIIDPREEARSLERRINEEMSSSELVEQAQLMGFDERLIKTAFKRKYEATGNGFSRLETLVDSILAMEEESAFNRSEEGRSSATAQETPSTSTSNLSTTSGLQEIRRLQKERMCEVCGNEQASVVLIPCGHIACCVGCAENTLTGPICRSRSRCFISTNEAGRDNRSEKERMCTNCGEDVARQRLIPRAQFDFCDRCDQRFSAEHIFCGRVDVN